MAEGKKRKRKSSVKTSSSKLQRETFQIVNDFSDEEFDKLIPTVASWERVFSNLTNAGGSVSNFKEYALTNFQSSTKRIQIAAALRHQGEFETSRIIMDKIRPFLKGADEILNSHNKLNPETEMDTDLSQIVHEISGTNKLLDIYPWPIRRVQTVAFLADIIDMKGHQELAEEIFGESSHDVKKIKSAIGISEHLHFDRLSIGPRSKACESLLSLCTWRNVEKRIEDWLLDDDRTSLLHVSNVTHTKTITVKLTILHRLLSLAVVYKGFPHRHHSDDFFEIVRNVPEEEVRHLVGSMKNVDRLLEQLGLVTMSELDYIKSFTTRHELFLALRLSGYCEQARFLYDIRTKDKFVTKSLSSSDQTFVLEDMGIHVKVPFGALSKSQKITFHRLSEEPPDIPEDEIPIVSGIRCCPSGLHLNTPLKLTIEHGTTFTDNKKASYEGIILYRRQEEGPKENWTIERYEYKPNGDSGVNVTLLDGKLILHITHFTSIWVRIKRFFLHKKRVSAVSFLPRQMPLSKMPVLHLHIYSTTELPKKIKEEEKRAKPSYCPARVALPFNVKYNDTDVRVTCTYEQQSLSETIPYEDIASVSHNQVDFQLDFTNETIVKNIGLQFLQDKDTVGKCIIPTSFQVLPDVELMHNVQPESSTGLTEERIKGLSEGLPCSDDKLVALALALKFTYNDYKKYKKMNSSGGDVNRTGTLQMLMDWKEKTKPGEQVSKIRDALVKIGCVVMANNAFPNEVPRGKRKMKQKGVDEGESALSEGSSDMNLQDDRPDPSRSSSKRKRCDLDFLKYTDKISDQGKSDLARCISLNDFELFFQDLGCSKRKIDSAIRQWGKSIHLASLQLLNECTDKRGLGKIAIRKAVEKNHLTRVTCNIAELNECP